MGPTPWKYTMLRDRTTVLTFRVFGKYNNPPAFSGFYHFEKGPFEQNSRQEIEKRDSRKGSTARETKMSILPGYAGED